MFQTVTITSKRQFTIPADFYRKMGFKDGQKAIVTLQNDKLQIEPAVDLVKQLAGSIKLPRRFAGKSVETIAAEAKQEYFKSKSAGGTT